MTELTPTEADVDRSRVIETTLDLLAFDTQNPPGETGEIVDYLDDQLTAAGLETARLHCTPDRPNLVAWFSGQREPDLVFQGHVDTVPFDREAWTVDPLGERDGETIYGRGATDMKGAVAAMVETARLYAASEADPPVPLGFAFVSDEEVTGDDTGLAAMDLFDSQPAACVIGEQTGTVDQPSVTVADKGAIWLQLAATGTAAHGSRPMLGENALDRLYNTVEELRTELTDIAFDLDPALEEIIADSVGYYASTMGEATARRLFEQPTVNLGTLSGGEAINSVPAAATAGVDIRLTAGVPPGPVVDRIRGLIDDQPGVEITAVDHSQGTYEPVDAPLVAATAEAASNVTGRQVFRRSATGGGDAKTLRNAGISTVEFALGTDTAHAVDERTTVEALVETAAVYTRVPALLAETLRGDQPDRV